MSNQSVFVLTALVALHFFFAVFSVFIQWQQLFGVEGLLPQPEHKLRDALEASLTRTLRIGSGLSTSIASLLLPQSSTDAKAHEIVDDGLLAFSLISLLIAIVMIILLSRRFLVGTMIVRVLVLLSGAWFLGATVLYDSLLAAGEVFMSFQWDIMLCEVGFLSFVVLGTSWAFDGRLLGVHVFLVRLLLFKLLFLSGVVKLQAGCSTWWELSAGYYHHATQCLPTPLAWRFFHGSLFFHKFSIAAVLFQQLFISLLLVAPIDSCARFALLHVAAEQVLILLSGNYCFFNSMTLALAFVGSYPAFPYDELLLNRSSRMTKLGLRCFVLVCCLLSLLLLIPFTQLFSIDMAEGNVRVLFSRELTVPVQLGSVLAAMKLSTAIGIVVDVGLYFVRPSCMALLSVGVNPFGETRLSSAVWITSRNLLRLVMLVVVAVVALTMTDLHVEQIDSSIGHGGRRHPTNNFASSIYSNSDLLGLPLLVENLEKNWLRPLSPLSIAQRLPNGMSKQAKSVLAHLRNAAAVHVHSYGLFRHMTGVGRPGPSGEPRIARPEVIVQGRRGASAKWLEYEFHFKPGNVSSAPRWNIPHQPRLDWQMWFAALGEHPPHWLIHLVYRFFQNDPQLMDELVGVNPFRAGAGPDEIRLLIFHYNFTDDSRDGWWRRTRVREMLPSVRKADPQLVSYLQRSGLLSPADTGGSVRDRRGARDKARTAELLRKFFQTAMIERRSP